MPEDRPGQPRHAVRSTFLLASALVIVTALSSAGILVRGQMPFTSDRGIVSLMALDIRDRGAHPVFCYGVEYGGTVEAHLLALVFSLLPATPASYHLTTGFLTVLIVLLVWRLARFAFGETAGFLSGLYLALGPSYFLLKGLSSDGSYDTLVLSLGAFLFSALQLTIPRTSAWSPVAWTAAAGLSLGLAWWLTPLAACAGPVLLAVVLLVRKDLRPLGLRIAVFIAGFLVGGAPWWIRNLETSFLSLRAAELTRASAERFYTNIVNLFLLGWPTVLGGRSPASDSATFPGAIVLALLLFSGLVVFGLREAFRGASPLRRRASILLLTLIGSTSLLSLTVARADFGEPRYLLPTYLAIAPLVGAALDALRSRRLLLGLAVAGLLVLNLGSQWRAPHLEGRESTVPSDARKLADGLIERGIRAAYAPYWAAYRLTFLTGRRVVLTPFGSGNLAQTLHAADRAIVDASESPAFLLDWHDAPRMYRFLMRSAAPYRTEEIESFTLFTDVAPSAIATTRRCVCIPLVPNPREIVWLGAEGPSALKLGEPARYHVRFKNRTGLEFQPNVHIGYRLRRTDGSDAVPDTGRFFFVRPPVPYETVAVDVDVHIDVDARYPVPPGDYNLVFDLVDEGVTWFEWRGLAPLERRVRVLGPVNPP